jgi:hypothetical protein
MKNYLLMILILFLFQCTGSRAEIKLEKVEVPVSLSAFLYGEDGQVLVKNKSLKVIGKFKYEKRFWGILWTMIRLSNDDDVSNEINKQVNAQGGDGIINLMVESDYCSLNAFPFLGLLPIWPGCTIATFNGEIIKAEEVTTGEKYE